MLAMAIFLTFFRLGGHPIEESAEARIGINAIEILQNSNYLNLSYGGNPDQFQYESSLVNWLVATNFSLFGYSTFSLRLHSAIGAIFIFFFLFKTINLYRPPFFAFGVCLMLFSVQAIIGFHLSHTGNANAIWMAFLFAGLYYFLRYLDFMRYHDIYKAAILWGFAFLAKGAALGMLFPGLLLYLWLDGRLMHVLRLREVYKAVGILLLFPVIWFLILYFFGQTTEANLENSPNIFARIFGYGMAGEGNKTPDSLFLWDVLRANFRYWDLIFYALIIGGIGRKFITGMPKWEPLRYRFTILSFCIWLPLAVFFSLGPDHQYQDFTLAIPFIAITTMSGIWWLYQQYPKVVVSSFLLFWVFCLYYRYLGPVPQKGAMSEAMYSQLVHRQVNNLADEDKVYQVGPWPSQRVLLELYFANPHIVYASADEALADPASNISVFIRREEWEKQQKRFVDFGVMDEDELYLILEKN